MFEKKDQMTDQKESTNQHDVASLQAIKVLGQKKPHSNITSNMSAEDLLAEIHMDEEKEAHLGDMGKPKEVVLED